VVEIGSGETGQFASQFLMIDGQLTQVREKSVLLRPSKEVVEKRRRWNIDLSRLRGQAQMFDF
jgi:hypothetical protein